MPPTLTNQFSFRESGQWAVILGGSSGFGLATAKRLASAGLNLIVGHKDSAAAVVSGGALAREFDEIRAHGVELVTHNGNLSDDEERGALFELIEEHAGTGKVQLFLHSIAAGSCKLIVDEASTSFRKQALEGLSKALAERGIAASSEALQLCINDAFHEHGCDAFYPLAESRLPYSDEILEEEDIAKTLLMMGYDYLLWGRELLRRGCLARTARLVALTSEGNLTAFPGYAAVSAAKCALEALCRSMAVELAPHGVRSFLIQAGITDTPAGNGIPHFDLMKAAARMRNPFHRLTTPEDVADTIYALCLPLCDWVNGAVIRVDGGEANV